MNDLPFTQDIQILIWIPLALMTAREIGKNWRQIFDKDLTLSDRSALQKINIFFILPIVVLLHEIGHALAVIAVGGVVAKLHFGIWWGYVLPQGHFTALEHLIITVSGSLVQIIAGFICLVAALFATSPPIVALLVYSGLYAVGGTVIIYALMSLAGMYGDWVQIYTSPLKEYVAIIAVIHASIVVFLVYCIYGVKPRVWFAGKTRPKWRKDYLNTLERIKNEPSAVNYLSLAWSYFFIGLTKETEKTLAMVKKLDPTLLDRLYLHGCLYRSNSKQKEAIACFEELAQSELVDNLGKARALMAIGHCMEDSLPDDKPEDLDYNAYGSTIETYDQAAKLMPDTADPIFYKASLLNKVGLHKEAEFLLKDLDRYKWLDPSLRAGLLVELKVARSSKNEDE